MNTDTEPIYKFEHASFFQKSIYRDVNHDFYGVYSGDYGKIYVISKGFGREGTEIISELAINAVKSHFEKLSGSYSSVTAIKHSFQAASQAILTYSADRTFFKNYGACLSLILINHDGMFFGNVGDCKIALLRKGKLEYVTKYNNAYKDLSIVDNNEVLAKISKNPVFTEAIGVTCERPEIIADIEIEKNDCFLIATKGVFQRVTRLEIQNAFTMWDLSEGLETVWESAQNKKSYDDFTMIALRLHKPSKSSNKGKKAGKKTNLDSPKNRTKSREPSRRTGIAFLIIFIISLIVLGITAYPYFGTLYHMIVDLI